MIKYVGFIVLVLSVKIACASSCGIGYYLDDNNQCVACNTTSAFYCPGDDTRHQCPVADDNFYQWALDTYGFSRAGYTIYWTEVNGLRTNPSACVFYNDMQSDTASLIYFTVYYDLTTEKYRGARGIYYTKARSGYYLKSPISNDNRYFRSVVSCTNASGNAHYTGAGTNDTYDGTIVDANDCPWECDNGYGRTDGGQCLVLCDAGITKLHIGNFVFNIYANKQTAPALNIKMNDTVCYVSLATGAGTNTLHLKNSDGAVYHTIN